MAELNSRVSTFLPTIKCSMCHRDIQISQMGDHVCGGEADPTPPPDSPLIFDLEPQKEDTNDATKFLNPGRAVPPRVDISAANRPFLQPDQLTPVSLSPSRSVSPFTPNDRSRSPFGMPPRSATTPLQIPPSPSISTRPQLEGGYGGFGKPATPDLMYAPVSPRTATSGGLFQRADRISPGPFDISGNNKADDSAPERGHIRQRSLKDATMSTKTIEIPSNMPRPSTASGHSQTSSVSFGTKSEKPKVPGKNGYGGFGPPASNGSPGLEPGPFRLEARSQTFPLPNTSQEPSSNRRPSEPDSKSRQPSIEPSGRRPSEPDPRLRGPSIGPSGRRPSESDSKLRRPSIDPNGRRPSTSGRSDGQRKQSLAGPDLTRPLPPPRGVSLIRPRADAKPGEVPPIPSNLNLAEEFGVGNPYHIPSESQSSATSGSSHDSKATSGSTPPPSTAPDPAPWKPSDSTEMDNLMSDIESSMTDLQMIQPPLDPSPQKEEEVALSSSKNQDVSMLSPVSPVDPAIQNGLAWPLPPPSPARSTTPSSPGKKPGRRGTTSKGNCKGCSQRITGKSVSSADGRLTGRYHKECFVCNTCSEPFQTSTFYVINDAPYCERHYHKLNGSVCTTCDRGIEGQYLESERRQKFHPRCLICSDCKRTLRHDYFEMGGRVYCERDAFRRAQQGRFLGPSGRGMGINRMERRTTRMMMM